MKRCNKCGQEKDDSEFYRDSRSKEVPKGTMPSCKLCINAANRERAAKHPERAVARTTAWRSQNPGRASAISRAWQLRHPEQAKAIAYKGRYKIDFETFWQAQEGKCASCHEPMVKGGKDPESVCVDHDRSCCPGGKSCGKCVRGLIHRNCNLVLGYAKDDLRVLRSAVAYLEQWHRRFSVHADHKVQTES